MTKKEDLGPREVELTRDQMDEIFFKLDKSIKTWLDVKVPQMVENKIDALREDNIKIEIIKKLVG